MLSDEQINIINNIINNKNVICDSVAGSGKTTTILELAKILPNKLILQITYNSMLRYEVKEKAKNIKNLEVHSYHSLYVNYYNSNAYTDIILNNIINNNSLPIKKIPNFDIIVIDEVQDMTFLFYAAIKKLINDIQKEIQIVILGDKNQAVYDFKGADYRFLTLAKEIYPNSIKLHLTQSFRVTRQIANFINHVLLGEYRIKSIKNGSNVNYLICNTFKIYKYLFIKIRDFLNNGYKPDDIFILCPSFKSKKLNPVKLLENELTKSNIPCYLTYNKKIDDNNIKNKIVFTTFHQSKGRERKIVFVYNFDTSYFNFYNKNASKTLCPASIYVAITRASEHLFLLEDTNYYPLPFLKCNYLEMTETGLININYMNHNSNNKKDLNITEIWISDLVKYIDEKKMNEINKYINLTFDTIDNIPNKFNIKTSNEINELNSLTITSIREYKNNNNMTLFNKIIDYIDQYLTNYINAFENIVNKIESSINNIKELKKNCYKLKYSYLFWFNKFIQKIVFPSNDIKNYLYLTNFYLALVDNIFYKLVQTNKYNWIDENQINKCIDNMNNKIIYNLKYEKILNYNYNYEKYGEINILGRINAYDENNIYNIICTDNILNEHLLELICNTWLIKKQNNNHIDCYIYNIVTDELKKIINLNYIDTIMELLLDNKLLKKNNNSDLDFIDECITINNKIKNFQPQTYKNKFLFIK
jgi:hypothetical protein